MKSVLNISLLFLFCLSLDSFSYTFHSNSGLTGFDEAACLTGEVPKRQSNATFACAPDDGGLGSGDISGVGSCANGECALEGGNDIFPFIFEGTANTFETTFSATDPTADRAISFPDAGGEVSLLGQTIGAAELETDSVSADELNALGVEAELEAVLDLQDMQGAVTDAQVPDTITASNYMLLSGGTFTGQVIADNLGIEFEESDTNPACAAGNYNIFADLSEAKFKKCTNGTLSDLDTGGGGGGSVILDLGDDGTNESTAITEIATINDTGNVWSEPAADKLLFDGTNLVYTSEIDTSAEIAAIVTDKTGNDALVFANAPTFSGTETSFTSGTKTIKLQPVAGFNSNPRIDVNAGDLTISQSGTNRIWFNNNISVVNLPLNFKIVFTTGAANASAQSIITSANFELVDIIGNTSPYADIRARHFVREPKINLTASTTQTQGQTGCIIDRDINVVATVANTNDTCTMMAAVTGRGFVIRIINNGANTMQLFPASGDNLGAGVNTAVTIASGVNVTYVSYDDTNWEQF